jgi:hypothetical protein
MKNIIQTIKKTLLFKSATSMPRWAEIYFGILGWGHIILISYAIIKHFTK